MQLIIIIYLERTAFLLLEFVVLISCLVHAEEECQRSTVFCFECHSQFDRRCNDPFNQSAPLHELPPLKECHGCCVKLVQFDKSPQKTVRRTCTSNIRINFFMVDHVCMMEGTGDGHMCFCEENMCNSASLNFSFPSLLFSLIWVFNAYLAKLVQR